MKRSFTLSMLGICLSAITYGQQQPAFYSKTPLRSDQLKNIEAVVGGGSISVAYKAGEQPRAEVSIRGRNADLTTAEIKAVLAEYYDYDLSAKGDRFKATINKKQDMDLPFSKQLEVTLNIYSPHQINTDLSTAGGSIRIAGLSGDQDITTAGGELDIENIQGTVKGGTSGANVVLLNSNCTANLSTAGGNITAKTSTGNIDLATSGGWIAMDGLTGHIKAVTSGKVASISANNINGDLSVSNTAGNITLTRISGGVDAVSTNGNVYASIRELRANSSLFSSNGNVKIAMPKTTKADLSFSAPDLNVAVPDNFTGRNDQQMINGKINKGGAELKSSSASGQLKVEWL